MPTLEVRWFFPQAGLDPSRAVRPADFNGVAPAPVRVDWYAPANMASGVKLRDGNLEVKLLLEDRGVWPLADGRCRGAVQLWNKWIYRNEAQAPPSSEVFHQAGWIPVEKRRRLIKFENRGGSMCPIDTYPINGCQVEWTEVLLAGTPWLTICLEAVGDASTLSDSLRQTAQLVLPELCDHLPLDEAHSRSYPQWLQDVTRA